MASRDWSWVYMQTNKYFTDQHVSQIEEFMKSLGKIACHQLNLCKSFLSINIFSWKIHAYTHKPVVFSKIGQIYAKQA